MVAGIVVVVNKGIGSSVAWVIGTTEGIAVLSVTVGGSEDASKDVHPTNANKDNSTSIQHGRICLIGITYPSPLSRVVCGLDDNLPGLVPTSPIFRLLKGNFPYPYAECDPLLTDI